MAKKYKNSSLLAKYSLQYKRKPRSRVFAPLAETYRKLGMYDNAFKVLKEGIRHNPSYVLGYIVLANCYFDKQNYELAYNTLRPFVEDNLENLTLQKLFAQTCINLGYLEEALQTFKYLLLLNPRDEYVAEQVKLLEDDLLISDDVEDYVREEVKRESFEDTEDQWVQVDFNRRSTDTDNDIIDSWSMENQSDPLNKFKSDVSKNNLEVKDNSLDDEYFHEDYDNDEDDFSIESDPIITHTLVELYCKQGHYQKAIEILESILELHPKDQATKKKLKELKELDEKVRSHNFVGAESQETDKESDSEEEKLLNLVENNKKELEKQSLKMLENKLNIFMEKIKRVAKEKRQSFS
tara:strand:- start:80925 stop:81980 length:1056 start_codon:yes stop_codon:yes gene_type:complete